MNKSKMKAFPMRFKEKVYDAEGNVKYTKDDEVMYQVVWRMVHHNPAYFPKHK